MIRLYDKIAEDFLRRILQDRFWVVHIPFVRVIKLLFLAQLSVDHLTQPVISSRILFFANLLHLLIVSWSFHLYHHITDISCFVVFIILINNNNNNIYSLEFFTSALADGFSWEIELQQVSSSLQESSQYSGRLQFCCCLDGLHLAANFQIFKAL